MKLWRRKPKFVPDVETVPSFVMNDEEIVDVVFVEWTSQPDGSWQITGTAEWDQQSPSTHMIHETPIGCLESEATFNSGRRYIGPAGGPPPDWYDPEVSESRQTVAGLCRRTLAAREAFMDAHGNTIEGVKFDA